MKPVVVIGLGNPLMGDDGAGCAVAERLAGDQRLSENVEVICGGSDLLRYARHIEGRNRVVVIDAMLDDGAPGRVLRLEDADSDLDDRQEHAHGLSAVQAIRLLALTSPVRWTLLGISISTVAPGTQLSPALDARMPAIVDRVIEELTPHGGSVTRASRPACLAVGRRPSTRYTSS